MGSHRHCTGVLLTLHLNRPHEAFEGELDEAFFAAEHPLGACKGWEAGSYQAFAIALVAGSTEAFALVNRLTRDKFFFFQLL